MNHARIMKANTTQYFEVTEAKHLADYKLLLTFNAGTHRIVDFGPFLKQARNPMFTKYRRLAAFKAFHIQDGDLMWGDFEMIFPIMDLYHGTILKGEPQIPAHYVLSETSFAGAPASKRKAKPVSYRKTKRALRP